MVRSVPQLPTVGARTLRPLDEMLAALAVALTPGDLEQLESAVNPGAVAGTRYAEPQMRMLDSER